MVLLSVQSQIVAQESKKAKKADTAGSTKQDKEPSAKSNMPRSKATASTNGERKVETTEERKGQLILQARQAIESALAQAKDLQNPVVQIKIRSIAADALWDYQEEMAKGIVIEDFRNLPSLSVPQEEKSKPPIYKHKRLDEVKETLRKELIAVAGSHDPVIIQSLLGTEKGNKDQTDKDSELLRTGEMLGTAMDLAETSPETASRIIEDSLKTGINPRFALALITLRQSDPARASALFNEAFSKVRTSGDLWEFQKLVPYVLPTGIELHYKINYLANPQRVEDAKRVIDYATVLLNQQITSPQVNAYSFPEMIRRERDLWRSLLQLFNDLAPEKAGIVNTRLNQLSSLQTGSNRKPAGAENETEPPPVEERLKKLTAMAESAIGARKDALLFSAASAAMQMEDYDKAVSLIEKIENQEKKEIDGSFILSTISARILSKDGSEKALVLARGITWPGTRVAAFSRIYAALQTLKKQDQANELLDELRTWLDSRDNTSDKVWGWLIYLDYFAKADSEKAFAVLSSFVGALNKADLEPPAKPLASRNYWYPEFHDFRKSLGPLVRTDFERALQEVQLVKDKEALLLIQVALCNEYLKANTQKATSKVSQKNQN
jgi:hypothetical protein